MARPGRKSWTEEMKLAQRYSDLSEDYFKILKEFAQSEDKNDRKWAAQELSKAFVKMIPQDMDITSGGEPIPLLGGKSINASTSNNSNEETPQTQEED